MPVRVDADDDNARRFLLGRLTESEAERFEERLLADEEFFELVEATEDELFDARVRNELDPDERRRFDERFGTQKERLRFASALAQRMERETQVVVRNQPMRFRRVALAAAAAIAIVVAGAVLWQSPSRDWLVNERDTPTEQTTPSARMQQSKMAS